MSHFSIHSCLVFGLIIIPIYICINGIVVVVEPVETVDKTISAAQSPRICRLTPIYGVKLTSSTPQATCGEGGRKKRVFHSVKHAKIDTE